MIPESHTEKVLIPNSGMSNVCNVFIVLKEQRHSAKRPDIQRSQRVMQIIVSFSLNNKIMVREYTYRNDKGQEIQVTEFSSFYTIGMGASMKTVKTRLEVEQILSVSGYKRKGFKDELGVTRHSLSRRKIDTLYRNLDNFIADCTVEEYKQYKESITAIKTLLHSRMI